MGAGRTKIDRREAWEAIRKAGGRVAFAADALGIAEEELRQLLWGESQGTGDAVALAQGGAIPELRLAKLVREEDVATERVDVPALDITKLGLPEK